jgi:coenzyme F420-0:L-glutamate ligase/coenzyme F420-1:gamma-L-glutamate ligase
VTLSIVPVEGIADIGPGDDLAAILAAALTGVATEGDAIAVTQKVVSKSEGRVVPAADREAAVEAETVRVVARRDDLVIAATRHGFVCANAGVDASNVAAGTLTLLPEDPDASAERLRTALMAALGIDRLGVVITDTFGRPWREGLVNIAIGVAGFAPIKSYLGDRDPAGRPLQATILAIADELAGAAEPVMGKLDRIPAALVRGLPLAPSEEGSKALLRDPARDLFR